MSTWTQERARIAALTRSRPANDPELVNARRNLRAERLALHIGKAVAEWPPLSPAQLDRLSILLRGGDAT